MSRKRMMRWKHIFLMLMVVVLSVDRKTWRGFPKHYRSIGYVTIIHIIYYKLCRRHLVWDFTPLHFNWKLLRNSHIFIITPLLILLFLSNFPSTRPKQVSHVLKWVLGSTLVEFFIHKQRMIEYKHGWNSFWSCFLYLKMYLYSLLFERRPWLTCILSVCSGIFFIMKFNVPIKSKHPFSRRFETLVDLFYHSKLEDLV